jgi:hypothetical protein
MTGMISYTTSIPEHAVVNKKKYRDIFKAIDEFTALHFTVTGASPAAKCTRILPVTQYA